MKRLATKIVAVCLVGVAMKWAWEKSLAKSSQELNLNGPEMSVELRAKLGQNLALALLGGFRGVVADFSWLKAHEFWQEQIWYKLKEYVEMATLLQPKAISFWDIGAWHMAWNASYAESVNPKYANKAYQLKMKREWIDEGQKYLRRGLKNNPDNWDLWFKLGWIYYNKYEDPYEAVTFLKKAATFPEAPLYVGRMVGHAYVKAGKTQEAYDWWKKLWAEKGDKNKEAQMWYKIAGWGREAEKKLGIPEQKSAFPKETTFPSKPKPTKVERSK